MVVASSSFGSKGIQVASTRTAELAPALCALLFACHDRVLSAGNGTTIFNTSIVSTPLSNELVSLFNEAVFAPIGLNLQAVKII